MSILQNAVLFIGVGESYYNENAIFIIASDTVEIFTYFIIRISEHVWCVQCTLCRSLCRLNVRQKRPLRHLCVAAENCDKSIS